MNFIKHSWNTIFVLSVTLSQVNAQDLVAKLPGELIVDNTGQANYFLPIDIPVGINGMEPRLSLEYSSSGGSGIMGVGWSLSGLEQISRSSRNYAFDQIVDGIDYDENDQLSYDGERLKLVGGANHLQDGAIYRKYVDDFSRITAKGDSNGPTHLMVETKSGLVKTFGLNDNSSHILNNRIGVDDARVAWMLDKIQDVNGNYIDYKYQYDAVTNEILIDSILYTGNESSGISPYSKIEFIYDQHTQVRSRYFLGARMLIENRLSEVHCYSNNVLVWRYDLEYEDSPITQNSRLVSVTKVLTMDTGEQSLPPTQFVWRDIDPQTKWENVTADYNMGLTSYNGKDRGVRFVDINGDGLTDYVRNFRNIDIEAKLNTGSGWTDAPAGYLPPEIVGNNDGHERGVRFIDLNGDGLVDMLKYHNGGQSNAWLNSGSGWEPEPNYAPPHATSGNVGSGGDSWANSSDYGTRFVDLNGDGLMDMLWNRNSQQVGAVINTGSGWQDAPEYYSPYRFVDEMGRDKGARLVDVNGDNLVDLIWNFNGSQKGARLNSGNGWELTNHDSYIPKDAFVNNDHYKLGSRFTDLNGDGLLDCVYSNGYFRSAYVNTGVGWLNTSKYKMINNPFFAFVRNMKAGLDLVDLNGDGIDDLAAFLPGYIRKAYINQNGTWVEDNRHAPKIALSNAPEDVIFYGNVYYETGAKNIDLNGDGILDQVSYHNLSSSKYGKGAYINKQSKPDLLEKVIDGFEATTSIAYAPITNDTVYTREADAAQLEADFPIAEFSSPMWVVHQVSRDTGIEDALGQTIFHQTSYRYAGARMHQQGLGFLGFRTFISKDEQTGLIKADILEQAPFFAGMKLGTKSYGPNGQLLAYTSNSISAKMLNPYTVLENDVEVTKYRTIHPYYDTTDVWTAEYMPNIDENYYWNMTDVELENHFFTHAHTHISTNNDLDTFGNKIEVSIDYGDGYTHEAVNVYYNYTDASTFDANGKRTSGKWFLGLLDMSTSTHTAPDATTQEETIIRNLQFTYDTNYKLYEEIVEPGHLKSVTTRYGRDPEGRLISTTVDPNDHSAINTETHTLLDASKRFYTETSNALNHKEERVHDPIRGWVTSQKGPNQRTTYFDHDALGRVIREDRPDKTWTTTQYVFDDSQVVRKNPTGGPSIQSRYRVTVESLKAPPVTTWYDRLGRAIRSCTEGFDGQTIYQDTIYNDLGQVEHVSENYYAGSGPSYWTKTTFDAMNRVDEMTTPDGTKAKTLYNGRETVLINNYTGFNVPVPDGTPIDGLSFPAGDYSENQTTKTYLNVKGDAQTVTSYIKDDRGNRALTIDYRYNGAGNLLETQTTSPLDGASVISMTYDIFGNKVAMDDPDMGLWHYGYNALGELTEQYDAEGNATVMDYDDLGRMTERSYYNGATVSSGDGIAGDYLTGSLETTHNWYYDGDGRFQQLGKLRFEKSSDGFKRAHYYDDLGRTFLTLSKIEGRWFYEQTDYDAYSRPTRLTHYWRPPAMDDRLHDHYYAWYSYSQETVYDDRSFVTEVRDANGQTWWSDPTYNEHGQITSYLAGNILETNSEFDPATHLPERVYVKPGASGSNLLDHRYDFDRLGNLTQRSDDVLVITEIMDFDTLNRLTGTSIGTNITTVIYDDFGNIKNRSSISGLGQIGAYDYLSGTHRVHNADDRTFAYNLNGSITSVTNSTGDPGFFNQGTISWTAFNKPYALKSGNNRSNFGYDTNNARVTQTRQEFNIDPDNGQGEWQNRTRKTYVGALFEQEQTFHSSPLTPQSSKWDITSTRIYIASPSGIIGSWIDSVAEIIPTKTVFHRDHLGSVIAESELTTSVSAQITKQFSYDAWGLARDAGDWDGEPASEPERIATDRGYTGHEMLNELGLVHMNGRIYDPLLGRFLSADPYIQAPANLQNYNRYSYVLNNPVSLNDPSGFYFNDPSGNIISGIVSSISNLKFFKSIKSFLGDLGSAEWVGNLKSIDLTSLEANLQSASANSQTNLQNTSQINTQGMTGSDPGIDRNRPSGVGAATNESDRFSQDGSSENVIHNFQSTATEFENHGISLMYTLSGKTLMSSISMTITYPEGVNIDEIANEVYQTLRNFDGFNEGSEFSIQVNGNYAFFSAYNIPNAPVKLTFRDQAYTVTADTTYPHFLVGSRQWSITTLSSNQIYINTTAFDRFNSPITGFVANNFLGFQSGTQHRIWTNWFTNIGRRQMVEHFGIPSKFDIFEMKID